MNKFTDRFLEVPVLSYNPKEENVMGKESYDCELVILMRKINPLRIESYCESIPAYDFREDNKIWTKVTMQSNDEMLVDMPYKEFEKLLNGHSSIAP